MPGTRLLTLTQFRLSSSSADIRLGHTAEFLLFVCVFVWLSEGFKGSLKMSRSGLESSVSCQRAQWTRSGTVWYPLQFKNGSKCSLTWRLWHQMLSHFYYVLIFDEWTIIWLTQVRKGIQDGTIWRSQNIMRYSDSFDVGGTECDPFGWQHLVYLNMPDSFTLMNMNACRSQMYCSFFFLFWCFVFSIKSSKFGSFSASTCSFILPEHSVFSQRVLGEKSDISVHSEKSSLPDKVSLA